MGQLTTDPAQKPAPSPNALAAAADRLRQKTAQLPRTLTIRLALHYGSSPFVRIVDTGEQIRKGRNGKDKSYPYAVKVPRVPLALAGDRSEHGAPQCEFRVGPLLPGETRFVEARGCGAAPVDEKLGQGWGSGGSPAFYEVGYTPEGQPFKRYIDEREATLLGFTSGPSEGSFDPHAESAGTDAV